MAKLSAHGQEIGRIIQTTSILAYMSDGAVLKNAGFGWKIHAKVKAGINPIDAFNRKKASQAEFLAKHPCLVEYRKALHELAGIGKQWKVHTAVSMMPDDCDGVWSHVCDDYTDNIDASIDEISQLCQLYKLATNEAKLFKNAN